MSARSTSRFGITITLSKSQSRSVPYVLSAHRSFRVASSFSFLASRYCDVGDKLFRLMCLPSPLRKLSLELLPSRVAPASPGMNSERWTYSCLCETSVDKFDVDVLCLTL